MARDFFTGKEYPNAPCDRKYARGEWKGGGEEGRAGKVGATFNAYSRALFDEPHLGVWTTTRDADLGPSANFRPSVHLITDSFPPIWALKQTRVVIGATTFLEPRQGFFKLYTLNPWTVFSKTHS